MIRNTFWLKEKRFFIILSLMLFLFLPIIAIAQPPGGAGQGSVVLSPGTPDYEDELTQGTIILEEGNLIVMILEAIRALLAFTGAAALVMIIFAGQKWMMAGGNEENIKKAKALLRNALIGLSITLLSYTLATWGIASLQGGMIPPILFFL